MDSHDSRPSSADEIIDKLCVEFQSELAAGKTPRIEDYLPRVEEPFGERLLRELLAIELERDNTALSLSEFEKRFPAHANEFRDFFQTLAIDPNVKPSAYETKPRRRIGRYKLLQEIGQGGMGSVWMAEQLEPVRRRVAIKLIKSGIPDERFIARFEAERQALAMMDHQNIAKVLDAGSAEDGTPYFVMELVQGVPITEYCDNNELTPRERLALFIPVCRAVQHAHQKGIIHRDLKPNNVLVSTYDGEAVPKVIDFGLAKTLQPEIQLTEKTMFTQYGQVVGTIRYMSPEQATLDGMDIDTRSDIYSLGVMLYELLTGSTPIEQETLQENQLLRVLEMIREQEPPRPSNRLSSSAGLDTISQKRRTQPDRLRKLLRGDLDWIVMKAIDADRNRRYESAANFAEDVRRYLDGQPIFAHPPSAIYSVRKFIRKHRVAVLTGGIIACMLIVATAVSSWFAYDANQKRRDAEIAKSQAKQSQATALSAKARSDYFVTGARWNENRVRDAIAGLTSIPEEHRNFEWNLDRRLYEGCDGYLYGHTTRIRDVDFCPARHLIASASSDRTVRVWNPLTHREIHRLDHSLPVYAVAFSPSGQLVASVNAKREICIWDLETQQLKQRLTIGKSKTLTSSDLCALDFRSDATSLAAAVADSTVRVWDLKTGSLRTLGHHDDQVFAVSFSPDGTRLASASKDQTVKVWQLQGDDSITLAGHDSDVVSVDFSPDGNLIASSSVDRSVRIWDAETGSLIRELQGHRATVYAVEFSPDSMRLASGSADQSVCIWDIESGEQVFRLRADNWVRGVSFSGDGSRLVTAVAKNAQIWDTATGTNIRTLLGHRASITGLEFSPDGKWLVSSSKDNTVCIWNLATGFREARLAHADQVNDLAIDSSSQRLLTSCRDGDVRLWDLVARTELTPQDELASEFFEGTSEAHSVDFSPNGEVLATSYGNGLVKLWNTKQESLRTLRHGGRVRCVEFAPGGKLIATCSTDTTIKIWDRATGELKKTLGGDKQGHSKGIYQVRFSPDGHLLASASQDDSIRVWNVSTGHEVCRPLQATKGPDFYSVAFNADATRLAGACGDGTIRIWDTTQIDAGIVAEVRSLYGYSAERWLGDMTNRSIRAAAFSPDGRRLATGSDFGSIRLWDGSDYDTTVLLLGHFESVKAYVFDSSGERILTGSTDKSVRLWDARSGELLSTYSGHTLPVRKVAFSDDEKFVVATDSDGIELAWDTESGASVVEFDNGTIHWENHASHGDSTPRVVLDDRRVVLVNRPAKPALLSYYRFKNKPNPYWHQQMASVAEQHSNTYAALFHHAWAAIANDELDSANISNLRVAFDRWRSQRNVQDGDVTLATRLLPARVRDCINEELLSGEQ